MDPPRSSPPGALPVSLTPLIGREREVRELVALIENADNRIVTVTGPGGVGKTRLAVAAATTASPSFPDGIWFVDLAPITDPNLAIPTIAKVLGLKDDGLITAAAWIESFLTDRQVLVILDNLEQIPESAVDIARLVSANSGLTVLVTSRVRLRVTGEHQYPLSPLNVTDQGDGSHPVEDLAVVRLFADRARAVQPDFQIAPDNVQTVVGICRHLDGLPLAIELAAARISMFAPAAILDRLEQHLPLLTGGPQDRPERQQTMQNAIGWSYDLLSSDEQVLLRRLSVFVGGFSIGAAESVASAHPGISDSLTSLSHLHDCSLVRRIETPLGDTRFGMLETVREFGLERLAEAGEHEHAIEALVSWASSFMEEVGRGLLDLPRQSEWRAKVDVELGNVRTAINWLLEHGHHSDVLRLVADLGNYWPFRPYYLEVLHWLETALESDQAVDPLIHELALQVAVYVSSWSGQSEKAIAFAEQGIRIGREIANPNVTARAMMNMGVAWEACDDPASSLEWFREAIQQLREAGATIWIPMVLTEIGDKLVLLGTVPESISYFEEALSLVIQEEYEWGIALIKGEWGFAELALGNLFSASRFFTESYESGIACGDPRLQLGAAAGLAGVALALGESKTAIAMLGTVESARIGFGIVRPTHNLHINRLRTKVQASLGEDEFRLASNQGKSISLEEAVTKILLKFQALEDNEKVIRSADPSDPTARELEVLRLLVQGKSDREIADTLFIGSRTVQTHVSNLLAKLEVSNRAEAAAVAVRNGLV